MATSALPDFSKYDDDKLDAARIAILTEQERRARLASIPTQLQQLAAAYVAGGGDLRDLTLEAAPGDSAGPSA